MRRKRRKIFLRSISVSTKPDGCFPLFTSIRHPSRLKAERIPHFRFNRGYAQQFNKAGLFVVHVFGNSCLLIRPLKRMTDINNQ